MMHHWYVVSPEMSKVMPVLDDGTGPIEDFHDVTEVDAPTAREALRIGVPQLRKWFDEARSDKRNPRTGVKAIRPQCPHLGCWCKFCQPSGEEYGAEGNCPECEKEHRAECQEYMCGCWTPDEINAKRRLDREFKTDMCPIEVKA